MGKISIMYLAEDLRDVRDQAKNRRKNCANKVLERLGYIKSKSISIEQFDALLIRAINQSLGISRDADVLLMAFGLMRDYHYGKIILIGDRRQKYLAESNYLETHPRKQIPYANATKEQKEKLEDNLRKAEDVRIKSLARFLSDQDFPQYIDDNIQPIAIPQPSYISLKDEPPELTPAGHEGPDDDDVPDEVDENVDLPPEDKPAATEEQEDSRSKERKQPHASTPPQSPKRDKTHKYWDIKHSVVFQFRDIIINIQPKQLLLTGLILLLVLGVAFAYGHLHSPTEDIPTQNEPLAPGEIRQIVIVVPSEESAIGLLKYISSDPDLIDVSSSGFLMACQSRPGESSRSAEIQVLDETDVIATESYTVDFTKESFDPPVEDINDFVPDFTVSQKIRVAGDTEWHNYVDAKVGDELEIQFEYRNTSEHEHVNVAVRDILPANLGYIPGSTTLYTTQTSTGLKKEDGIAGDGIYIGTYGSGSNACIRFRVRVVDINLADGVTGLVNWSQACVNGVTLQDFATVRVSQ